MCSLSPETASILRAAHSVTQTLGGSVTGAPGHMCVDAGPLSAGWVQQPGDNGHFVALHSGEHLEHFCFKEDTAALSGFLGFGLEFWRAGKNAWAGLGALFWAPPAH